MTDPFFALRGEPREIASAEDFFALAKDHADISNALYRPDRLDSPLENRVYRIRGIMFSNFSFAKTEITNIEFQDCEFRDCLFMGTVLRRCRFTDCKFIKTNVHRIEFENVFVDPRELDSVRDSDPRFSLWQLMRNPVDYPKLRSESRNALLSSRSCV
jgi:uncharacterized protein YjbI with pentapeptide repeats